MSTIQTAFADGVEHEAGFFADQRAFQRQEVPDVGKDSVVVMGAQGVHRLVHPVKDIDLENALQFLRYRELSRDFPVKDQDTRPIFVHRHYSQHRTVTIADSYISITRQRTLDSTTLRDRVPLLDRRFITFG